VPNPDSSRKTPLFVEIGPGWLKLPGSRNRISDRLISTITVRTSVARSELMPLDADLGERSRSGLRKRLRGQPRPARTRRFRGA